MQNWQPSTRIIIAWILSDSVGPWISHLDINQLLSFDLKSFQIAAPFQLVSTTKFTFANWFDFIDLFLLYQWRSGPSPGGHCDSIHLINHYKDLFYNSIVTDKTSLINHYRLFGCGLFNSITQLFIQCLITALIDRSALTFNLHLAVSTDKTYLLHKSLWLSALGNSLARL